jgi:hypothetical protein
VHVDVKKLGRILATGHRVTGSRRLQRSHRVAGFQRGLAGWEFVHVCVDDHSRLAYVEVLKREDSVTAIGSCGVRSPGLASAASSSSG